MTRFILFCLITLTFVWCKNAETKDTAQTPFDAELNFKKYCASCHGDNADVFVDRRWKHGKDKDSLIASINTGFPEMSMPAWSTIFKPQEVSAMADYLLKAIANRSTFDFVDTPRSNLFVQKSLSVKLDTIAKGFEHPWGLATLPDGDILFTERDGALYKISKGKQTLITGTPKVVAEGQGGLLDIELHPKFAENKWIYLTYSKAKDTLATTALMRAKLVGNKLTDQKDIFVALPYLRARHHYGSRIEFDKDGFLFFNVSDRGAHAENLPQLLDNDLGKIHRLHDDGSIPTDNPFFNTAGARKSIWTYGHRNIQGMAINPSDAMLWSHEHGPRGGDELNPPVKGKNYGWPTISYGINYDGSVLTALTKKDSMEQPITYWVPSIAPSGLAFVSGTNYPAWQGDLLMGSLRFKYLNRVHFSTDGKVSEQEILLKNVGRVRIIEMGKDGYLYVGVEEPGFIFRISPISQ